MAVRELTEDEQIAERNRRQVNAPEPEPELPRHVFTLRVDLDTPPAIRVGKEALLTAWVMNLESRQPPLHRKYTRFDPEEIEAQLLDPCGHSQGLDVERLEQGKLKLELTPRIPGLHTLNISADGQGFCFAVWALPEEA